MRGGALDSAGGAPIVQGRHALPSQRSRPRVPRRARRHARVLARPAGGRVDRHAGRQDAPPRGRPAGRAGGVHGPRHRDAGGDVVRAGRSPRRRPPRVHRRPPWQRRAQRARDAAARLRRLRAVVGRGARRPGPRDGRLRGHVLRGLRGRAPRPDGPRPAAPPRARRARRDARSPRRRLHDPHAAAARVAVPRGVLQPHALDGRPARRGPRALRGPRRGLHRSLLHEPGGATASGCSPPCASCATRSSGASGRPRSSSSAPGRRSTTRPRRSRARVRSSPA